MLFQPLTIITKRSILDVAAALDPPLVPIDIFAKFICDYYISHRYHQNRVHNVPGKYPPIQSTKEKHLEIYNDNEENLGNHIDVKKLLKSCV